MISLFSYTSALLFSITLLTSLPMYDFGNNKTGQEWYVINDGVMGGLSQGKLSLTKDYLHYEGRVSLENNGGFASIRAPYGEYDLTPYKSVEIRYKSTSYDFAFVLENRQRFYEPTYKHNLPSTNNKWVTLKMNLVDFGGYQLGRKLNTQLTKQIQSEIIRMGFISNEKRAGDFDLSIDYIKFE